MTQSVSRRAAVALQPLAIALAVSSTFAFEASAQTVADSSSIIVTASRTPQSAKDVLSDYTVITGDELAQAGQNTLVDLLQQKRGIEITRNGGPGNTSSVFIRGTSATESIVLVDGIRIGSSTIGGATWETIPLSQIERVEIVYGPLSSLYGADAVGGVVQIFTKQGSGAPHVDASAGVGSYGTRKVDAGVSGSTGGSTDVRYAFFAAHEESDGFSATKPASLSYAPDKDGYTKDSFSGRVSAQLSKDHEIGLNLLHSRLNAQYDSDPGYDNRNVLELNTYGIYSKNKFLPTWTSLVQLAQSDDKGTSYALRGKSSVTTKQTQLSWQNDIAIGNDVLQLLAERREEKVDSDTSGVSGTRTTNSLAASYQLRRGDHLASAALRTDHSSQYGTHTTGSIEYGYRITKDLRANVSYGTSFRAPTFNDLYYPGYGISSNKPEQGKNAEAGLYYNDGTTNLSAVYYRNRVSDLLVYAAVCPVETATHPYGCSYNVDQALLTGLSLAADTKLGNFDLRASLDLQDPKDETTGKRLARRSKKHGSIGAEYGVNAYKVGAELVFSGDRFDDTANRNRLGGYGLLNLYADYEFARGWTVFGRWNNATDKNYELARNYATPGSNVFVGVRYAMK
jgi:vitamin B12 transporter